MESWTVNFWLENSNSCLDELKKDSSWEKIPLMNSTHTNDLIEGQLVRFCGMIQDMFDPVYYLALYEVEDTGTSNTSMRSGKFKDSLQCAEHERILFDSEKNENKDRLPVYCISVPAVNEWAKYTKCEATVGGESARASGVKRSVDNDVEMTDSGSGHIRGDCSKRLCSSSTAVKESATDSTPAVTNLNLPIPNSLAEACMVNFYDVREGELKINDVVEVAGFLSYDPVTGIDSEIPPPSLVPRVHAVTYRPMLTSNPLVTSQVTLEEVMTNAQSLRADLKLVLTQLLLGDALAADYLICHLISHVYLRQGNLVLGKFSLNLMHMPRLVSDYTSRLYHFLSELVVKSTFLLMTIDNMNVTNMIPRKNYETNRLESGMLQLSNNTHLVIDETQLSAGMLTDKGVRNSMALSTLIRTQSLQYDFEFYPVEFHADIPVLSLSKGKSFLPSDCQVPIEVDESCLSTIDEVFTAAKHYLKEPLLSQLRVYLSLVTTSEYDISPALQEVVQEDFVEMRRENPKTTAQDLHFLLVLARLLSLSQGSPHLSKKCWKTAQQMELQRKQRLSKSN